MLNSSAQLSCELCGAVGKNYDVLRRAVTPLLTPRGLLDDGRHFPTREVRLLAKTQLSCSQREGGHNYSYSYTSIRIPLVKRHGLYRTERRVF